MQPNRNSPYSINKYITRVALGCLLAALLPLCCAAQCSPQYTKLLAEGDRLAAAKPPQYEAAVKKYNAALLLCPEKSSEAQGRIIAVFKQIEQMRADALQRAEEVKRQVEEIQALDRQQLALYRTNLQNALGRYEIVEARGELDKMRQTQLASAQELAALERQIVDTVETLKPDMVWVEGGTFMMGCDPAVDDGCRDDETLHEVRLDGYYLGTMEVTQALWQKVMGNNPSYFKPPTFAACPDCPVESVSWNDAQEFIQRLNERTGMAYRLPTEAEWEYAARGGNQSKGYVYAGGNDLDEVGWYEGNSDDSTHPVGQKLPNGLGLYDMTGNVWEWCQDWYSDYPEGPLANPKGPEEGVGRVYRGGCWSSNAVGCRVANRDFYTPAGSGFDLGLRLARNK